MYSKCLQSSFFLSLNFSILSLKQRGFNFLGENYFLRGIVVRGSRGFASSYLSKNNFIYRIDILLASSIKISKKNKNDIKLFPNLSGRVDVRTDNNYAVTALQKNFGNFLYSRA